MLPNIHDFLDYRAYLKAWFDAKKVENPRYSHRAFVRRTGQKSPSLLSDMIAGRRNLTDELIPAFAKALGLHAAERRFLQLLVQLDRADTADERNEVFQQIAATRRWRDARELEGEAFRYASTWYFPAVRELARRPDFRADPTWIAGTLVPSITVAQARDALGTLLELGLLVQDELGTRQADSSVVSPREVAGLAVHNYHRGMLELAGEGIGRFKARERHFIGVTVCVPEALVPELKERLGEVAADLLERCDGADGDPERVYQLGLHLFPLSESP